MLDFREIRIWVFISIIAFPYICFVLLQRHCMISHVMKFFLTLGFLVCVVGALNYICDCSYQVFPMWWINRFIHLCLLLVLLLCAVEYVWFHANLVLLWVHGLHMLWFLSHAWDRRFSRCSVLRPSYLPLNQVRVVYQLVAAFYALPCILQVQGWHPW